MAIGPTESVHIEFQQQGPEGGIPLLLINGLGSTSFQWPAIFLSELVAAGLRIITVDLRDSGRSTLFDAFGDPDILGMLAALEAGEKIPTAPYSINDMARDLIAVLDQIEVPRVSVFAQSSGGAIAQALAAHFDGRISSAVFLGASTNATDLSHVGEDVARALRRVPDDIWSRTQIVAKKLEIARLLQGSRFRTTEANLRKDLEAAFDYFHCPPANHRQTWALLASGNRTHMCAQITVPALILQGTEDPLISIEHAVALRNAIPNAELQLIKGLGHGLSALAAPEIVTAIRSFLDQANVLISQLVQR